MLVGGGPGRGPAGEPAGAAPGGPGSARPVRGGGAGGRPGHLGDRTGRRSRAGRHGGERGRRALPPLGAPLRTDRPAADHRRGGDHRPGPVLLWRGAGRGREEAPCSTTPGWYMALAVVLFVIGASGLLLRRNALVMFMSVELMLERRQPVFRGRRAGTGHPRRPGGGPLRDGGRRRRGGGRPGHHRHGVPPAGDCPGGRVVRAEGIADGSGEAMVSLLDSFRWEAAPCCSPSEPPPGEPAAGVLGTLTVASGFGLALAAGWEFLADREAQAIPWFDWLPALGVTAGCSGILCRR